MTSPYEMSPIYSETYFTRCEILDALTREDIDLDEAIEKLIEIGYTKEHATDLAQTTDSYKHARS